jgi:nucleotide-binding universal stress UspA family protein
MTDTLRPDDWDDPVRIPEVETTVAKILVPLDGSHAAERALGYADALARRGDSEVVVVVAFDPPLTMRRRAGIMVEDARHRMEEEATELAEESVALLRERGNRARGIVVRGDITEALLETIEDESADLVVMGRRGVTAEVRKQRPVVGAVQAVFHGSVADKVSRHARVPVLLVG